MIAHENVHDPGLRYNFMGTLVAPLSSSVMDYTSFDTRVALGGTLGAYDVDAVRFLYGLSPALPAQPFCTDDAVGLDPDCQRFDTGADPFAEHWTPRWELLRDYFVRYGVDASYLPYFTSYTGGVFDYARNGDDVQANRALDLILDQVGAPIDPALLADPSFIAAGADLVLGEVLRKLGPAPSWPVAGRVDQQLRDVLLNVDGIRSHETRRDVVDILEGRQHVDALGVLLEGKAALEAELAGGGLAPVEAALARDLLVRIERATSPYFD
jgi:hypothetical protein